MSFRTQRQRSEESKACNWGRSFPLRRGVCAEVLDSSSLRSSESQQDMTIPAFLTKTELLLAGQSNYGGFRQS